MTELELFVVFFSFEKFLFYFLGTKVIGHIYNSALRYLMANYDSNPR